MVSHLQVWTPYRTKINSVSGSHIADFHAIILCDFRQATFRQEIQKICADSCLAAGGFHSYLPNITLPKHRSGRTQHYFTLPIERCDFRRKSMPTENASSRYRQRFPKRSASIFSGWSMPKNRPMSRGTLFATRSPTFARVSCFTSRLKNLAAQILTVAAT